jgi:hypothetical protein
MARRIRLLAFATAYALAAAPSLAQRPVGAEDLSRPAVAESLKVLAALQSRAVATPADAALQYRIGRIAFALVLRSRMRDTLPGLDRTVLQQTAYDALSNAVNGDARNVEYLLTYSAYLTSAYNGKQAVELARQLIYRANDVAAGDPTARGRILLQIGDGKWRDYERSLIDTAPMEGFISQIPERTQLDHKPFKREWATGPENHEPQRTAGVKTAAGAASAAANDEMRRETSVAIRERGGDVPLMKLGPRSILEAAQGAKLDGSLQRTLAVASMRAIERLSRKGDDKYTELQERHYLFARTFYDSAYALIPADERAWRAVSKVRVERNEWPGIEQLAEDHVKRAPADQWGHMALGLARQRQRQAQGARIEFDAGLAGMPAAERAHLDRVDRLMRPGDIPAYSRFDSTSRARYDAASWFLADPLWSVDAEEPRLEFLARITHAELRWGTLVPRVYGADTDDGTHFVRYGPPVKRLNNLSLYPGGLILSTCGVWLGSFCEIVRRDRPLIQRQFEWQPARWDNISQIDIDSMPVQAARFRIAGDSVDLFFATRAPVPKLDSVATANVVPFAKFWIHGWNSAVMITDSLSLSPAGGLQWTYRLPQGAYNYRVEAIMPGTLAAGRATANIVAGADTTTGFAMFGFGMSDLLLASRASMPSGARRWSDVEFTPLLGTIPKGGQLSVVWENYEVGRRGSDAEYHVTMTLAREEIFGGKISFDIIDGITSVVRRSSKTNQIALDYDRLVPYAATIVDNLTLSFGNTPEGAYNLTVAVTDKVSGRTTARSTRVVITK